MLEIKLNFYSRSARFMDVDYEMFAGGIFLYLFCRHSDSASASGASPDSFFLYCVIFINNLAFYLLYLTSLQSALIKNMKYFEIFMESLDFWTR